MHGRVEDYRTSHLQHGCAITGWCASRPLRAQPRLCKANRGRPHVDLPFGARYMVHVLAPVREISGPPPLTVLALSSPPVPDHTGICIVPTVPGIKKSEARLGLPNSSSRRLSAFSGSDAPSRRRRRSRQHRCYLRPHAFRRVNKPR